MKTFITDQDQIICAREGERTLQDNFTRFHEENPLVYETLVQLARRWKARGLNDLCGIGRLFEIARWEMALRTTGEPLKLNNNYRAFYARLIMTQEADLAGIFVLRKQRSED